jgi:hypothetical protein
MTATATLPAWACLWGLASVLLSVDEARAQAATRVQFTIGPTVAKVIGSGDVDAGGELSAWWVGGDGLLFGADVGLTNRRVYSEAQLGLFSGDKGPAVGLSSGVLLGWDGPVGLQSTIWTLWSPAPLVPFFRVDWLPNPWSSLTVGVMVKLPVPLLGFLFSRKGI